MFLSYRNNKYALVSQDSLSKLECSMVNFFFFLWCKYVPSCHILNSGCPEVKQICCCYSFLYLYREVFSRLNLALCIQTKSKERCLNLRTTFFRCFTREHNRKFPAKNQLCSWKMCFIYPFCILIWSCLLFLALLWTSCVWLSTEYLYLFHL